jgi:hypothetical protein
MRNAFRFGECCVCILIAAATLSSQSASAASPKEATFYAREHRFDGPETIPAGQTTIRLRNRGKEPHQLHLLKLEAGRTPASWVSPSNQARKVSRRGPNRWEARMRWEQARRLKPRCI